MRSDKTFPMAYNPFLSKIEEMWEDGCLDEFADSHFLIQSIMGKSLDFRNAQRIRNTSSAMHLDGDKEATNYLNNLSILLSNFEHLCGSDILKKFVRDQLSAGKGNYDEDQFFQAVHELHILRFLTRGGSPKVEYEPPIGGTTGKMNPEYRINLEFGIQEEYKPGVPLDMEKYILDVEVKSISGRIDQKIDSELPFITPLLPIQYNKRKQLEEFCKERGFQLELPDVIHLRDFLNSASEKFIMPLNDNHFNILFLNWTHREIPQFNFMEPLGLLNNEINGLLSNRQIGENFGLSKGVFEKISAIFMYSYPMQSIVFQDFKWIF